MSNHLHPPTSRPKNKRLRPEEEEAAAELKLGPFQHNDTLGLPEARLILEAVMNKRREASGGKQKETDTLRKMQTYLDTFARFRSGDAINDVLTIYQQPNVFAKFEISQLVTLCCETAEEAKYLVPSIASKITDEDLQVLLDDAAKRKLVGE